MTDDCGHGCCLIRTNGYHVHVSPPPDCKRCRAEVRPRVAALTSALAAGADAQSRLERVGARRTTSTATLSSWVCPAE